MDEIGTTNRSALSLSIAIVAALMTILQTVLAFMAVRDKQVIVAVLGLSFAIVIATLVYFATQRFLRSRQILVISDPYETLRILTECASKAERRIWLQRVHDMDRDETDSYYTAIYRRIAEIPGLSVRRNILLRRSSKNLNEHLDQLKTMLRGKSNCEIRFFLAAGLGMNIAIFDDIAIIGIPREGGNLFSGALLIRDRLAVGMLGAAYENLWSRSIVWLKRGAKQDDAELEKILRESYERLRQQEHWGASEAPNPWPQADT